MKTASLTKPISINPGVLPDEELRQLVLQIVLRDSVEPFTRQMVVLLDSLKEGKIDEVAHVARQSAGPAFAKLMSALSHAVHEGEFVAARITVFLAAGYAYQETLDYFWDVMSYLDRFREDADKRRGAE
ncbi:MAG TPA: hypothetical protein VM864_05050 [Pyrinomonadaceae bacterium]|jgi:hypothetical protein|nr:hypothetical protein [Pyrinomonadaceae bacterium]